MIAILLLALLPLTHSTPQGEAPNTESLLALGWQLVPPYTGEHRAFLSEEEQRRTSAGAHLFSAGIDLTPDHVRGHWSLGHALVLLAEDQRNRGHREAAAAHYRRALDVFERALELAPEDPWCSYARGALRASFGDHEKALEDFATAVENVNPENAGEAGMRFQALRWRADVLMRAGRHEEARAALREFHGEFSTNAWPLHIALAESFARERNLAAAQAEYQAIVDDPEFATDDQAYAKLADIAALRKDRKAATERMEESLAREFSPSMWGRLFAWLHATPEAEEAAHAELTGFLASPPSDVSPWELTLGRFVSGEGTSSEFLTAARAEKAQRMESGTPLDDLMCEVWFYVGTRLERAAREAAGDGSAPDRELALEAADAYRASLAFRPLTWKAEWALARLRFAQLCEWAGLELDPGFTLEGERFLSGGQTQRVESLRWHIPGAAEPTLELGREPKAGDLLLVHLVRDDGTRHYALHVVGAPQQP